MLLLELHISICIYVFWRWDREKHVLRIKLELTCALAGWAGRPRFTRFLVWALAFMTVVVGNAGPTWTLWTLKGNSRKKRKSHNFRDGWLSRVNVAGTRTTFGILRSGDFLKRVVCSHIGYLNRKQLYHNHPKLSIFSPFFFFKIHLKKAKSF